MDKEEITEIAITMVYENGLINLSRHNLCERAMIPVGSFPYVVGCTFLEFVDELKELPEITNVKEATTVTTKQRVDPKLRREQILNVAIELSKAGRYNKVTAENIATTAGISPSLVAKYFKTMTQLRRAIIRVAISKEIPEIIAQGIANGDDHVRKAPPELRRQALELIANY